MLVLLAIKIKCHLKKHLTTNLYNNNINQQLATMKKTLLATTALAALLPLSANAEWTRITSVDQLKAGVDYVLVNDNSSLVMTADPTASANSSFRQGASVEITNGTTISEVPASAAILRVEKVGSDWAIRQTNGTTPGYLTPTSTTYRTIGTTSTPTPMSFHFMTATDVENSKDNAGKTAFITGSAVITAKNQSDKNILGIFKNGVNGVAVPTFQFCDQNDQPVSFYVDSKATGTDFVNWTTDPKNGAIVSELETITFTFEGCTKIDFSDDATLDDIVLSRNGENVSGFSTNMRGLVFGISFRGAAAPTAPGIYTLNIKAGTFDFYMADGSKQPSPEIITTVQIAGVEPTFTFSPANNSNVNEISSFTLEFGNVADWDLGADADLDMFVAKRDGMVISSPNCRWSGNPLPFSYRDALTEGGTYTFEWAAGMFELTLEDGSKTASPAITYTLNIAKSNAPTEFEADPANGSTVKSLEEFSISFPYATTAEISNNASHKISKEGSDYDFTGSFTLSTSDNKTFTFRHQPQIDEESRTLTDGKYFITFTEGSFLINGSEKSPEMNLAYTVDVNLVQGNTLKNYITGSFPEEEIPLTITQSDYGMNRIYMNVSREVTINKGCTGKIELWKDGNKLSEVTTTPDYSKDIYAEAVGGAAFGSSDAGSIIISFGSGERFEEGKYQVKVPADFFMSGSEMLGAATFNYCIGIGDWTPTKTVDLSNPSEKNTEVVSNGGLKQIIVAPYYTTMVLNETTLRDADATFGVTKLTIPGARATATLYRVEGKTKTAVAEFSLNSPDIDEETNSLIPGTTPTGSLAYFRQGKIVFNLDDKYNTPVKKNGDYVLEMPWNFFRYQSAYDEVKEWPEFENSNFTPGIYSYAFTVTGGRDADAPDQTYTISPEAGSYNPYPTVTLTYDGCSNIVVKEGAKAELYYGSTSTTPKYYLNITSEGNKVILTPESPITEVPAGDYTTLKLVVREGSYDLTYNGKDYSNYEVIYNDYKMKVISACPDAVPVLNYDNLTAADLLTINFEFSSSYEGTIANSGVVAAGNIKIYRMNEDGTETMVNGFKSWKFNDDKTGFSIVFKGTEANLTAGNYELRIPARTYKVTNNGTTEYNVAQVYPFSLGTTGVDGIESDNTLYNVFTFSGICVLRNANAEELNNLQPGLYIINGKKVMVK